MAGNYTFKQGDHLARIAHDFGFSDYQTIWNHPNNSVLKQQRQNPVLYPRDSVYIPDRETRTESRPTDQKHNFLRQGSPLKLRLILVDQYENPIANALCMLDLRDGSGNLTTDGNGKIERDIQPSVTNGTLLMQDSQTPFNNIPLLFQVGDLDQVDQVSAKIARLNNLGYFAGDVNQPDQTAFESSVEEFQCDQGLTVDGICGPQTQTSLKHVHGC